VLPRTQRTMGKDPKNKKKSEGGGSPAYKAFESLFFLSGSATNNVAKLILPGRLATVTHVGHILYRIQHAGYTLYRVFYQSRHSVSDNY
jgi:hypothetical protein